MKLIEYISKFIRKQIKLRPNKVKKMFLVLLPGQFLTSDNIPADKQTATKKHYDRKYIHIHTVILVNMHGIKCIIKSMKSSIN